VASFAAPHRRVRQAEEHWMLTKVLLPPLMVYAAAGLASSLLVNLLSYAVDLRRFFAVCIGALVVGIFPLWLVVVVLIAKMMVGSTARDPSTIILAECPMWVKYVTRGVFAFVAVNIVLYVVLLAAVYPGKGPDGPPLGVVWRFASAVLMIFYATGLATVTAAYRRGLSNLRPRCVNGHLMAYGERFCTTCGAPLDSTGFRGT
jgi:hypothetical protein